MKPSINMGRAIEVIRSLKQGDAWASRNRVATALWNEGVLDFLAEDLGMLSTGEATVEASAIELWIGIELPTDGVDFRILAAGKLGLWIDNAPVDIRIGSPAVLIPWASIFAIKVYSERMT